MASINQAVPATDKSPDYSSEIRFGVVLYGGVSLAIYINGVTNELFEMVAADPRGDSEADLKDTREAGMLAARSTTNRIIRPKGTREVYRRLAWLASNQSVRNSYYDAIKARQNGKFGLADHSLHTPQDMWDEKWLEHGAPVKLTVDVISGTSAGGINGIFLAKALATNKEFAPLRNLWIQEGDVDVLLNDRRSTFEPAVRNKVGASVAPRSLLNSDRMFIKLFGALKAMNYQAPESGTPPGSSRVEELDLFITTTDIAGSPVPLRLSNQVVYERRHKQNFHFRFAQSADGKKEHCNDFGTSNDLILAFAARCTSAFPFAFEPMTMKKAAELAGDAFGSSVQAKWHTFLSYLPPSEVDAGKHVKRGFGDGGYLDNKPFTYVAKTLATRQATVPVERKLIYVEPAPEELDEGDAGSYDQPPDALTNSLAALTTIPRYETIREDLQEVLRRNRSIERVDRIVREGATDLHNLLKGDANPFVRILEETAEKKVPPWPNFNREMMARYYGPAFLAYRRIRVSSTTDELAYAVARRWDIDFNSDHLYALTALLREWRNREYCKETKNDPDNAKGEPTVNDFLDQFDISYRIRRLSFLLRQIDQMTRYLLWRQQALDAVHSHKGLPDGDIHLFEKLKNGLHPNPDENPHGLKRAIAILTALKERLNEEQCKWRGRWQAHREPATGTDHIDDELKKELRNVLSLLLGDPGGDVNSEPVTLALEFGGRTEVHFSSDTLTACAGARSLQNAVLCRAKNLLDLAKDKPTLVHRALIKCIESLKRASPLPAEQTVWEILGNPELRLKTPEKEAVVTFDNPPPGGDEGKFLYGLLGEYYIYFDLFDQISFPLYHDAGIGEPATVEVVRISPRDATNLIDEKTDRRRKLAGTALANFGAFIDERWRRNDIMWGRLDGAERLIDTLLPMRDHRTQAIAAELKDMAHRAILRETLLPDGSCKVARLVCDGIEELSKERGKTKQAIPEELAATSASEAVHQVRELLRRVSPVQSRRDEALATMLASCLTEQGLIEYVRKARDVERTADPETVLDNASRAVTIAGRMLEEISKGYGKRSYAFRWLARFGQMAQALIAVSLPGSLAANLRYRIMASVYAIELLAMTIAFFMTPAAFWFTVKLFMLTGAVHLLIVMMGDYMTHGHSATFKKAVTATGCAALVLSGVGVSVLADKDQRKVWWQGLKQDVTVWVAAAKCTPSTNGCPSSSDNTPAHALATH